MDKDLTNIFLGIGGLILSVTASIATVFAFLRNESKRGESKMDVFNENIIQIETKIATLTEMTSNGIQKDLNEIKSQLVNKELVDNRLNSLQEKINDLRAETNRIGDAEKQIFTIKGMVETLIELNFKPKK
jgi:SUMO ligase MMS21 Smc5/6 complex component